MKDTDIKNNEIEPTSEKEKTRVNYFRQNDVPRLAGAALMALGLLFLFCSGFLNIGPVLVVFAWIAFPAGITLFIVASSIRTDEEEMDRHIGRLMEGLSISDAEADKHRKRLLHDRHPRVLEGYEYGDGLMYFKDREGVVRSSVYTKTLLYMMKDGILAVHRAVSMVSEEAEEKREVFYFDELSEITLRDEKTVVTYGRRSFAVRNTRFVITRRDGTAFSVPAHRDLSMEEFTESLSAELPRA